MIVQEILVITLILAAAAFVARYFYLKARSFSPKTGCGNDCGCSTDSGKSPTVS
ncbi:MAG: FeoB-associated Cys-rich membrane protein [Acidobacteria bacterium]|nr:FeoB-associated Cys-rich membrane protein [Acidobacteriota bacterium]